MCPGASCRARSSGVEPPQEEGLCRRPRTNIRSRFEWELTRVGAAHLGEFATDRPTRSNLTSR